MKVGVIGCGAIAVGQHIPAYLNNPKTEIKYFCDPMPGRAETVAEQFGCGIAVTDYRVVLQDPEVTAISICTPNMMHCQIAVEAMQAGKHVLCEKPAASNYEEALRMQQVQHETKMTLNIGVFNRFNDTVNQIKSMIDDGKLGEIYQVYVSFRSHRAIPGLGGAFTTKAIAGGGVLIDWGVHFLDIVMYCCGDPKPTSVSAETYSKLGAPIEDYVFKKMWAGPPKVDGVYDVEEYVTALIRTEGPSITLNGAWAQNIGVPEKYIDFLGTKGGVRLYYGKDYTFYTTKDGQLVSENVAPSGQSPFQKEIDAFVESIESGTKMDNHIDSHLPTAQIMDSIYRSAQEHREIKI